MKHTDRRHRRLDRAIERHDREQVAAQARDEFQLLFLDYEIKSSRVILLINLVPAGRLRTALIGWVSRLITRRATRKFAQYFIAIAATGDGKLAASPTEETKLIIVP